MSLFSINFDNKTMFDYLFRMYVNTTCSEQHNIDITLNYIKNIILSNKNEKYQCVEKIINYCNSDDNSNLHLKNYLNNQSIEEFKKMIDFFSFSNTKVSFGCVIFNLSNSKEKVLYLIKKNIVYVKNQCLSKHTNKNGSKVFSLDDFIMYDNEIIYRDSIELSNYYDSMIVNLDFFTWILNCENVRCICENNLINLHHELFIEILELIKMYNTKNKRKIIKYIEYLLSIKNKYQLEFNWIVFLKKISDSNKITTTDLIEICGTIRY